MLRCTFIARCAALVTRTVKLDDGAVLEGEFRPDAAEGAQGFVKGKATLADGRIFAGEFAQGAPVAGAKLVEDGDVYQGAFNAQWQRHGKGRAWLEDGTTYEGTFRDDELVEGTVVVPTPSGGQVVFTGALQDEQFIKGTLRQDNFVFTGTFENNEPHGKGRLEFDTGALHEGTFRRGKLHGEGCKMRLENGVVYLGDFVDGAIVDGEMRTPTFTYEGRFAPNGMADGPGRCEYLTTSPRLIFTGQWMQGKFIEGNVEDEYGAPIDRRTASQQVETPEETMLGEHAQAQYQDLRHRHREMTDSYVGEAAEAKAGGQRSDKIDLGYEHGPTTEAGISQRKQREFLEQQAELAGRFGKDKEQLDEARRNIEAFAASGDGPAVVDPALAETLAQRQRAHQQQTSTLMDEQFRRFQETATGEEGKARAVDRNEAWTGLTK